jgi:heterodisulfide reductase subunit D
MEKPPRTEELLYCLQCGYCNPVCPTFQQVGWESRSPRGILYGLKRRAFPTLLDRLQKSRLPPVDDKWVRRLYQCTGCGRCERVCHVAIPLADVWEDVRAWLVRGGAPLLPAHQVLAGSLAMAHNQYNASPLARAQWAGPGRFPESAYTVFFAGCTMSYEMLNLARDAVKILRKARLDFTMLGTDEWCCGHPLLLTGQEEEFHRAAQHNIESVARRGAGRLVTACPGCFWAFKHSYDRKGHKPPFEVVHISELLAELVDEGRLKFGRSGQISGEVVYHDPCLLGRMGGVLEPPRKVLESLPGTKKVLEFWENRQDSSCCGGGGLLRAIEEGMCIDIASRKVQEARQLGAGMIASSCPACRINLGDGVRRSNEAAGGARMAVRDLVELVARAL